MLFFFANDNEEGGQRLRKLGDEARAIKLALEKAVDKGMCEVVVEYGATCERIESFLNRYQHRVAVFHYAGHASSLNLMMEAKGATKEAFYAETLAQYLKNQDGLQLVFLNGCSTENQIECLHNVGVPYVVGTRDEIGDESATNLATCFYRGLADKLTIGDAWERAVSSVKNQERNLYQKSLESNRGSRVVDKFGERMQDQFKWIMKNRPGVDAVSRWNLPEASGNPLFGLPEIPEQLRQFPEQPFLKLQPFTQREASVFFGRGREILKLYNEVVSPNSPGVILCYGQSGIGKSSLLGAGLLPRLEGYQIKYVRRSANGILEDLKELLLSDSEGASIRSAQSVAYSDLRDAWLRLEQDLGQPLVVVLDQLEEAFSHSRDVEGAEEMHELSRVLAAIFNDRSTCPKGKLILAFAKDWLSEINGALAKRDVSRFHLPLERLSREGVLEAITLSEEARSHYGFEFESDDLVQNIVSGLVADRESPLAPTLQILMANLLEKSREKSRSNSQITDDLYSDLMASGMRMENFLKAQLTLVGKELPGESTSGLVLSVLNYHRSRRNSSLTRSRSERRDYFGDNSPACERVVAACKENLLLTDPAADNASSDHSTRLAHDTLAPLIDSLVKDSMLLAQQAERLLALRVPKSANAENRDQFARRELKLLEKARPVLRKLRDIELQTIEKSRRAYRKQKLCNWAILSIVCVAFVGLMWTMHQTTRRNEIANRENLIETWEPFRISSNLELFRHRPDWTRVAGDRVKIDLKNEKGISDRRPLLNVAMLKAWLKDPDVEGLHEDLKNTVELIQTPVDLKLFKNALDSAIKSEAGAPSPLRLNTFLRQVAKEGKNDSVHLRAKLIWLALFSGQPAAVPVEWTRPGDQVDQRTELVIELSRWVDMDTDLMDTFDKDLQTPPDLLAMQCQSIWFLEKHKLLDAEQKKDLAEAIAVHVNSDFIAVRSNALAILKRLGQEDLIPVGDELLESGEDWFGLAYFNEYGQKRVLDFARMKPESGPEYWLATTETPRYFLDQVLSENEHEIQKNHVEKLLNIRYSFMKLLEDDFLQFIQGDTPDLSAARFVTWFESLRCCNRINRWYLGKNDATYSLGVSLMSWQHPTLINMNGFRLPTDKEWQYAAVGGANEKFKFSYGDDISLFSDYGCAVENSQHQAGHSAQHLPNAFGMFDMHGRLREWCWYSYGNGWELPYGTHQSTKQFRHERNAFDKVLAQDGSFSRASEECWLNAIDEELAGGKRHLDVGFRLAISRRPKIERKFDGYAIDRREESDGKPGKGNPRP